MPHLSILDCAFRPPTHPPSSNAPSTFRLVIHLTMCLLPHDSSSTPRPVFHAASHHGHISHLPSHSIPWLPGLPPPFHNILQCLAQSAWHFPWHPLHHYVFHYTASLLATLLAFHHSATPSGCTTTSPAAPLSQPTTRYCMMSQDVAGCSRMSYLGPATASNTSLSIRFLLVSCWHCTLHISTDFGPISYIHYFVYQTMPAGRSLSLPLQTRYAYV